MIVIVRSLKPTLKESGGWDDNDPAEGQDDPGRALRLRVAVVTASGP